MLDIVIPTYNRLNYLKKTIQSVIHNRLDNIVNLIVFDNGSNDDTQNWLTEFECIYKFKYIRSETNIGIIESWNLCKDLGANKYVMLLHDDDELTDKYLNLVVDFIKKNNDCALIHTGVNIIDENGVVCNQKIKKYPKILSGEDYFRKYINGKAGKTAAFGEFICPTVVYNRELIPKDIYFNPKTPFTLDVVYFLKCTRYGNVGYISEPLLNYRVHSESASSSIYNRLIVKMEDRRHHTIFLKNEILNRLGENKQYLAKDYYYNALSADIWFYSLSMKNIQYINLLALIVKLVKFERKLVFYRCFWVNVVKAIIPKPIINLTRKING